MVYSQTTAAPNPERMLEMLRPMITEPLVLIVAISFFGVIVPLIEELFKPMGVWLLARRRLTPAQGFALGAISGAGYAVFETLGVQLPNELWLPLVSIRAVTGLLHVLTAGLVGYGLVEAWEYKRYLRLAALYLASVLLHGLWNSMVMLVAYSTMLHEVLSVPAEEALLGPFWMVGGGVGLFVIASVVFALLWGANQRLQPARLVPVGGEQDG
jgi:RsiW-degrading membrane proteinase PrsW (M82 family)